MISLPAMIERAARLNPLGTATTYAGRQHNWTDLHSRIARLGAGLQTLSLEEGDRVAVLSLNNDRYYESVFGIPWAGYCVAVSYTHLRAHETERTIAYAVLCL